MVFLSGRRRGQLEKLQEDTLRVVRSSDSYLRFLTPDDPGADQYQVTLHRAGQTYEAELTPDCDLWINGQRVKESRLLQSGDLVEIGQNGPVLRYRLQAIGGTARKSFAEAFSDAFEGARSDGHTRLGKAVRFLANMTWDLAAYTSLMFRVCVLVLLAALIISLVLLATQGRRLQKRVALEGVRIEDIAQMVEKTGARAMTREDLLGLQAEVESRLAIAMERLAALEARASVVPRVIAAASPSVAFIQGAFGFVEPEEGGRPLRYIENPDGMVRFTLEDSGVVVELTFTGTAFVVSEDGLFLTNRHVAEPWLEDPRAEVVKEYELKPVIRRLLAFLPGQKEPLGLEFLSASDEVDLALLKTHRKISGAAALELNLQAPRPGDEVLVLGYPIGIAGLVVRATPEFLREITPDGDVDVWYVAQRLAEAGYIKPLASRGIVSQVSEQVVLYDAETAIGGSGGPVLDLNGRVVAVNTAVVRGFGGSNVGVTARDVQRFLTQFSSVGAP